MKIKQKLKPFIYTAAVLCMSISCKKDEPPPTMAARCGLPNEKFTYKMTFENARADFGLAGEFIIEGLRSEVRDKAQAAAFLCLLEDELSTSIDKLEITYDFRVMKLQPYKYKVWGDIYNCDSCPTLVQGNVYYIVLKKIEYSN